MHLCILYIHVHAELLKHSNTMQKAECIYNYKQDGLIGVDYLLSEVQHYILLLQFCNFIMIVAMCYRHGFFEPSFYAS